LTVAVVTEPSCDIKPVIIEVDHDDRGWRVELRGQQRGESNRTGADNRHRAARRNLAVEHAAFEACRQDVAQHHQRVFIRAGRNRVEARVRVRDAHVLGLGAVDLVAEDPATAGAMRVHAAPTIFAASARGDARDQHVVAGAERGDAAADLFDDADALVPKDAPRSAARHVTLEDMQIGPADRRLNDTNQCVTGILQFGDRAILQRLSPRPQVNECLHCRLQHAIGWTAD
jgi:hypothetical protein